MHITEETIEKIFDAAEIVEVISKFVELKKSGVNYRGLCPFHQDHTPSLYISPSRQIFKCFVCGEGGNAVTFLMKHENMTYPEALRWLAKKYSIDIQECEMSEEQEALMKKRDSLFSNMAIVEDYYHKEFLKSEKAQQYAYGRWGKECCDLIRIGYAPGYSRNLDKQGITQNMLNELGLCDRNGNDLFRERITFSIRDRFGRVIGFICRNFDGSNPKYLNNADSDIFHKGVVLYGIDTAWKEINRTQMVYLVEGAPDCMQLQSIGVQNTVASLGSAWNANHFKTLNEVATKVCFIPDSDVLKPGEKLPHGIKVVTDAGRLALEKGLAVYVKEIPATDEKQDADSYFINKEIFDSIPEQDFILWCADKLFSGSKTIEEKAEAVHSIANVLSSFCDATRVQFYKAQLKKYTDGSVKTWSDAIKAQTSNDKVSKRKTVTTSSGSNPEDFGFKIRNGCYVIEDDKGIRALSNFTLTPLFHVLDSTLSRRIFTIENTELEKTIIELTSEDLTKNDRFEAKVGERGNYNWIGRKDDLQRVRGYLFAHMDTAFLIRQLGWQQKGFFAFGNGIYEGTEWHEADEYGIVRLEKKGNYYLPAHSMIYRNDRKIYQFEHNFIHKEGSTVTLRAVTDQITKVFGENGQIAFIFLLASMFHDIIAYSWFPLLDLFGPMSTGKTALADVLTAFFTKKRGANFNNATLASVSDEVGSAANAVVAFHEYKNSIDDKIIEFLKGLWDLIGRTRMSLNNDGQKEMTAVDSGVIITGQEMPTKDPALFSRCIFLAFSKSHFTPEETADFNKLEEMRKGGFTHLTLELLKYRPKMEAEYEQAFTEAKRELQEGLRNTEQTDRIIKNWSVLLAVYNVLKDELNIGFDHDALTDFIKKSVRRQMVSVKTTDELASFWNTLQYLFTENQLFPEGHFDVDYTRHVLGIDYDVPHPVLYIRKSGIVEKYQEACRRIGGKFIPKESLIFYMEHTSYYLGSKKWRFKDFDKNGYAKYAPKEPMKDGKFKQKESSVQAFAFDYAKLQEIYDLDLMPKPASDEEDGVIQQDVFDNK